MSNVLSEEKKQQVIALGRLGWSLRRIQRETEVRRETISAYLKEAGVELRPPRGRQLPAKPASRSEGVTPDSRSAKQPVEKGTTDLQPAKPASGTGDFVAFTQKQNGVLIKPRRVVDPDDVLTPEESALVKKAEREMRSGKFVTLAQLRHDLDRPHSRRRRKTA